MRKYKEFEKPVKIINDGSIYCCYGCGRLATHQTKCGKYFCDESRNRCPTQINKQKDTKARKTKEEKYLEYKSRIGRKQSEEERNRRRGPRHSKEYKDRLRKEMLEGKAVYLNKFIKNPSKQELRLREIVRKLYLDCEFQYPVLNYALDIALVKEKIAIEFDGWFHFNCEENINYHKKRVERIKQQGWKILKYTIFELFPDVERVRTDIERIL